MKRRHFLHSVLVGGAAAATIPGCSAEPDAGESTTASLGTPPFELDEKSIAGLREGLENGEYTSERLVDLYFKRMDEIDVSGPNLRFIIERNPDAHEIACELDRERDRENVRGPLHGIPVVIKDNIDTADRMMTTAGSRALVGPAPDRDAFLVSRLRKAGAIIIGKTNLSEWANFRSTRSSSGWSARGGQTRNPYVTNRNPCGSSSGSGVAASASLAAAAIGTETDGSVVCPATSNGIVGVKPTLLLDGAATA